MQVCFYAVVILSVRPSVTCQTCQFVTCARTLKHMTKLFSLLDGPISPVFTLRILLDWLCRKVQVKCVKFAIFNHQMGLILTSGFTWLPTLKKRTRLTFKYHSRSSTMTIFDKFAISVPSETDRIKAKLSYFPTTHQLPEAPFREVWGLAFIIRHLCILSSWHIIQLLKFIAVAWDTHQVWSLCGCYSCALSGIRHADLVTLTFYLLCFYFFIIHQIHFISLKLYY